MHVVQEEERNTIVKTCQFIHQHAQEACEGFWVELRRRNYVTPTSFLELITMFQKVLAEKRARNRQLRTRYAVGLEKLEASAGAVAVMQEELTALQPQLVKTVAEVEELMARIAKEKAEVVEPKAEVWLHRSALCGSQMRNAAPALHVHSTCIANVVFLRSQALVEGAVQILDAWMTVCRWKLYKSS